jgi:hypothetical protein
MANGPSFPSIPCGLDTADNNYFAKSRFLQNPFLITYTKAKPVLLPSIDLCLYCAHVGETGRLKPQHAVAPTPRRVSGASDWSYERPREIGGAPRDWGVEPPTYTPPTSLN